MSSRGAKTGKQRRHAVLQLEAADSLSVSPDSCKHVGGVPVSVRVRLTSIGDLDRDVNKRKKKKKKTPCSTQLSRQNSQLRSKNRARQLQ